jgi:hypothetical protein
MSAGNTTGPDMALRDATGAGEGLVGELTPSDTLPAQTLQEQGANRLPVLAAEIAEAHAAVQSATQTTAQRGLDAGRGLLEAKPLVPHGGWLPFLARVGIHERAAQRYMVLAEAGLESDMMSDLGIAGALRFIRLRKSASATLISARGHVETEDRESLIADLEVTLSILAEMLDMVSLEARS